MGELDLVKPVLEQHFNATVHFGRVLMKPGYVSSPQHIYVHGWAITNSHSFAMFLNACVFICSKPTSFATVQWEGNTKLVFCLPGNPVSCLVAFSLFVLPAIRKMAGHSHHGLNRIQVKVGLLLMQCGNVNVFVYR